MKVALPKDFLVVSSQEQMSGGFRPHLCSYKLSAVPVKIRSHPMDDNRFFRRGWWVSIDTFPVGVVFCQ